MCTDSSSRFSIQLKLLSSKQGSFQRDERDAVSGREVFGKSLKILVLSTTQSRRKQPREGRRSVHFHPQYYPQDPSSRELKMMWRDQITALLVYFE
jgi:hypothetical protein